MTDGGTGSRLVKVDSESMAELNGEEAEIAGVVVEAQTTCPSIFVGEQ